MSDCPDCTVDTTCAYCVMLQSDFVDDIKYLNNKQPTQDDYFNNSRDEPEVPVSEKS